MRNTHIILFWITALLMPTYLAGAVTDSEVAPVRPFQAMEITGDQSLDQELAALAYGHAFPQDIHLILPSALFQEVGIASDLHRIINEYLGDIECPYDKLYIGIFFLKALNIKIGSSKTSEENTTEKDATERARKNLKIVSSLIPACKTTPGLLTRAILDSLNDLTKKGYITSNSNSSNSMPKISKGKKFIHYIDASKSNCFSEISSPVDNPPQNQLAIIAGSNSWENGIPPICPWNNHNYCLVSVLYKHVHPSPATFVIAREQDQEGRYNDDWLQMKGQHYNASPINSTYVYKLLLIGKVQNEGWIPVVLYYRKIDTIAQQSNYLLSHLKSSLVTINSLTKYNDNLKNDIESPKRIISYEAHQKVREWLEEDHQKAMDALKRRLGTSDMALATLQEQNRIYRERLATAQKHVASNESEYENRRENLCSAINNPFFRRLPSALLYGIATMCTLYAGYTIMSNPTPSPHRTCGSAGLALASWGAARYMANQWNKRLTLVDEQLHRRSIN